jgi:hypothetical protein
LALSEPDTTGLRLRDQDVGEKASIPVRHRELNILLRQALDRLQGDVAGMALNHDVVVFIVLRF